MELWNVKQLNPPPITSFPAPIKEVDVRLFCTALKNAVDFFNNQKQLAAEAALLSRSVYRFKMKFRTSKDFKTVDKLNHALSIYLQMQMTKPLEILLEAIPNPNLYKINETYLPSKHLLDYVLVKMQSIGKLLIRIIETCKIVCQFMQQRLRLGHFWKLALIVYAETSRIYVISRALIKRTCELYSDLLPMSSKLSNRGRQWLPDHYTLPENLSEWLGLDWVDIESNVIEIEDEESPLFYFNLLDDSDDDIEFFDEYILVRDEGDSFTATKEEDDVVIIKEENDEAVAKEKKDTTMIQDNAGNDGDFVGFTNEIDVGEVINLGPESPTRKTIPKPKGKRKANRYYKNITTGKRKR